MPDDPRVRAVRLVGQMIDRDYTRLVGPVVRAIAANSERGALGKRLKELEAEAARLAEAGKRLTPDNAVARALLSDLDDALRANAALIDGVADDVVASGVRNAGAMVRGGALAGMTDAQLAALGVAWNVPDPEAVARLVQYTSSDAWTAALEKYQEGTGKVAQNALTRAFIEGKGPIAAARELRAAVTGLPVAYAEQMTRTLQLTSLRDSAVAHRVANSHIIEYQIRIAALDDRTCFPAGTLIATDNGQKPIEAVVVGDRVLTHTGKYRRVSATMRRVYSGQMVTLRHSRGSVVATANHPVLVNREGYGDWIPAEGVKVGDEVVVSGKYGGNYRNHAFGRVAIKRGVGNTDHGIPARGQPRSFLAITGGASMPIDAINFKRDIQAGQIEVNWITINARLLFVRLAKRLKAETNVALRFCFAYIAAIAARRAKLFMSICGHNSELFAARQTSVDHGRAAAFFRTVASLIAVSGEHFATPFARRIFGFCRSALAAANSVAVCVGAWHGEGLAADGANLFNRMSLMSARRPAVASVAFSDFGGAQFESLAADGTGELDSLTLAQSATGGATVHTVIAPFVEVGLPNIEGLAASGAGSLYHDEIISKTATQVKNVEVFNLEVERDHTYVANGLVVHNCASCVALHGTELPLDARIDDHHRGRCTSVTKVRGMAAPAVERGPDWFARQSEDRQRAMMGGARFEAWKAGAIQWGDMSRVYDDPVFGRMVGEASLKGMLGDGAKEYYKR